MRIRVHSLTTLRVTDCHIHYNAVILNNASLFQHQIAALASSEQLGFTANSPQAKQANTRHVIKNPTGGVGGHNWLMIYSGGRGDESPVGHSCHTATQSVSTTKHCTVPALVVQSPELQIPSTRPFHSELPRTRGIPSMPTITPIWIIPLFQGTKWVLVI